MRIAASSCPPVSLTRWLTIITFICIPPHDRRARTNSSYPRGIVSDESGKPSGASDRRAPLTLSAVAGKRLRLGSGVNVLPMCSDTDLDCRQLFMGDRYRL